MWFLIIDFWVVLLGEAIAFSTSFKGAIKKKPCFTTTPINTISFVILNRQNLAFFKFCLISWLFFQKLHYFLTFVIFFSFFLTFLTLWQPCVLQSHQPTYFLSMLPDISYGDKTLQAHPKNSPLASLNFPIILVRSLWVSFLLSSHPSASNSASWVTGTTAAAYTIGPGELLIVTMVIKHWSIKALFCFKLII